MQQSREIVIVNKLGMHARAAAKFVQLASTSACEIEVERNGQRVNGKSIMGVMMLAASKGSSITIHANGDDAEESINQLEKLIRNRFGEDE
jgi:phosphocarrier protein